MEFYSTAFWAAFVEVIWVNILLSGDNAVVIALAARSLPSSQRMTAVVIGSGAAVALRIALTIVAAELLRLPGLKLIGGVLLLYIGVSLLHPETNKGERVKQYGSIWSAVRVILIADVIMSLDNILAVAAAAHNSLFLLSMGLAVSIPLVVFGSALLMRITDRFPVIVWLGAGLIGFIAGQMLVGDPALRGVISTAVAGMPASGAYLPLSAGIIGACIVLGLGKVLR